MTRSKIYSFRVPPPLLSSTYTVKADAAKNLTIKTEGAKSQWLYNPATRNHIPAVEYSPIYLKICMEVREQQGKTQTVGLKEANN